MDERWRSRKLWTCLVGMLLGCLMAWLGVISGEWCAKIIITGMVGYPLANVAQRATTKKETTP